MPENDFIPTLNNPEQNALRIQQSQAQRYEAEIKESSERAILDIKLLHIESEIGRLKKSLYDPSEKERIEILESINSYQLDIHNKYLEITESYDSFQSRILKETIKLENDLATLNRLTLAQEFSNRYKSLASSKTIYTCLFIIGILSIIGLGIYSSSIILTMINWTLTEETKIESLPLVVQLIGKIFLTGPAIWFTWFFAKQYTNNSRIAEDYAFKAATALAFDGYNKAAEGHPEMQQELLQTAIRTFGENPTRLLNKHECTSPIQEAMQALEIIQKLSHKK